MDCLVLYSYDGLVPVSSVLYRYLSFIMRLLLHIHMHNSTSQLLEWCEINQGHEAARSQSCNGSESVSCMSLMIGYVPVVQTARSGGGASCGSGG